MCLEQHLLNCGLGPTMWVTRQFQIGFIVPRSAALENIELKIQGAELLGWAGSW